MMNHWVKWWNKNINDILLGEAGARGFAGSPGDAGARGPAGPQGPRGPSGSVGVAGQKGVRGDTGSVGPLGPAGPVGNPGQQGQPGDTGPTGQLGAPGPKGTIGGTGVSGRPGTTGATGAPGTRGQKGFAGFTGTPGEAGNYSYKPFRRNGSTCVDLVEDCKKAISIHCLCRNTVKSEQRKQNSCTHYASALITNYMYMHKIEQRTTGAISVIRENSVKCGNSWCLSERGYQVAQRKLTVKHATSRRLWRTGVSP